MSHLSKEKKKHFDPERHKERACQSLLLTLLSWEMGMTSAVRHLSDCSKCKNVVSLDPKSVVLSVRDICIPCENSRALSAVRKIEKNCHCHCRPVNIQLKFTLRLKLI